MSAPKTNVETQKKRHIPALGGMGLGVAFVAILLIGWLVWVVAAGNAPGDAEDRATGETGAVTQTTEEPATATGATGTQMQNPAAPAATQTE